MGKLLFSIVPFLLIMILGLAVLYPSVWILKYKQRKKRSPLTKQLLRSPGESLRNEIEDLTLDILGHFMLSFMIPLIIIVTYLTLIVTEAIKDPIGTAYTYFFMCSLFVVWMIWKVSRLMLRRTHLRLGLDGEMAVGQELNHLMLDGCRVFHDFPAEGFNIDHVVVGPGGVYAVETKGRAKPDKGRGTLDAKVIYDGDVLKFPDWNEKTPLEQAKRQSVWLTKWLSSAVGESVKALPALALPGWYVERTRPGDVMVFNGKSPFFLTKPQNGTALSDPMIQRISHQLEQRCRDVEPGAFQRKK